MKWAPVFVVVFSVFFSLTCMAQDAQVRADAVRLLERATAASTPWNPPHSERVDTFRAFSDSGVQEGTFTHVVIHGTGIRDEFNFGDFHQVVVHTEKNVAIGGSAHILPAELILLLRITPTYFVRFDHEDVIRSISDRDVNGRPAHCIEFDTIAGEKSDSNELCVDASNSTLLSGKLGDHSFEMSDYFPFGGVLMPGTIRYWRNGNEILEITQTITALENPSPNLLAAPPDAKILTRCKTFRRPFGVSMPQPKPGNRGGEVDIVVRGVIGTNGRVSDALIQNSDRPDLNAEALQTVQQWVFTPRMCNGTPNSTEASFTLHFQGR